MPEYQYGQTEPSWPHPQFGYGSLLPAGMPTAQPQTSPAPAQQQPQIPLSDWARIFMQVPFGSNDRVQQAMMNPNQANMAALGPVQGPPSFGPSLQQRLGQAFTSPSAMPFVAKTPQIDPFLQAILSNTGMRRPRMASPLTQFLSQLIAQRFGSA